MKYSDLKREPCVYIIKVLDYMKIGKSKFLLSRIKNFIVGSPIDPDILYVHYTEQEWEAYRIENRVHDEMRKYRHRGEWYHYSPEAYEKAKAVIVKEGAKID